MESRKHAPLTPATPMKRWISWRGEQKPLLALALPEFQALERMADPDRVRRGWLRALDRTMGLDLPYVGLPEGLWHEEGTLLFLATEAAARGLGILLPLSLRSLPRGRTPHLQTLDAIAASNPSLIVGVDLSPLAHTDDLDPLLEEEIPGLLRERRIPYHCMSQDPLGAAGPLIRRAGFTADLTGTVVPRTEALDPWWLHASCMAARMPDRPCSLSIAASSAEQLHQAAAIGLTSGMGLICLSPRSASAAMEKAEDLVLAEIADFVRGLPRELEEPLLDPARSFLFRETDPGLAAEEMRCNEHTAPSSLLLLRRLGFATGSFLFEEQRREPAPAFLHVPAQGPLHEDHWMRLHQLAFEGCQVLITGLCLDADGCRHRLQAMGLAPRCVEPSRQSAYPPWMRSRPVLNTGQALLSIATGRGSLAFLDQVPERSPGDPVHIPGLADLVSKAMGTNDPASRGRTKAWGGVDPHDLLLEMPSLSLSYDIRLGDLRSSAP